MKPEASEVLILHILAADLPKPTLEYRFYPKRRWRFDFAWPDLKLALEIEGGSWVYGRHNRPQGFLDDMEKYNAATLLGWKLLRFTPQQIQDGLAIEVLETFIPKLIEERSKGV